MTFREFYRPIVQLDDEGDGMTASDEFVRAMNFFRNSSNLRKMLLSSAPFWFAVVFILAGCTRNFHMLHVRYLSDKVARRRGPFGFVENYSTNDVEERRSHIHILRRSSSSDSRVT